MTQQTTLPTRPTKKDPADKQVWTVWSMFLYFINSVYDTFVNKFATGFTTVPNSATTVVVTHSLGQAAYAVLAIPTTDPGGRYWVSNKTATQFTLNLQVAAGVSGVPFDWMVKAV